MYYYNRMYFYDASIKYICCSKHLLRFLLSPIDLCGLAKNLAKWTPTGFLNTDYQQSDRFLSAVCAALVILKPLW